MDVLGRHLLVIDPGDPVKNFVNLQLSSEAQRSEDNPATTSFVVEVPVNLSEGDVFPPDLLPSGVQSLAPIIISATVECRPEWTMPGTVDTFGTAQVVHPDGDGALAKAFTDAGWEQYRS